MPYEALSRALAYVSCLSSMTLFATSMAVVAVNVGKLGPPGTCAHQTCVVTTAKLPSAETIAAETLMAVLPKKI